MWHKVGKMDPLIFHLWYAKNSDISLTFLEFLHFFEKITKNGRQPVKPKNRTNELKFHDQIIELA